MVYLLVLLFWMVSGQVLAHDWYSDLKNSKGSLCCGGDDCAPYPYRHTPGETGYELLINGRWWPVPSEAVLGMFSPDDQAHACCFYGNARGTKNGCEAREPVSFRCVVLPGQGV